MRWFLTRRIAFTLSLWAASAPAQSSPSTITPASLVGTWTKTNDMTLGYFLVFRPDSTFGWSYNEQTFKHWRALRGDTLILQNEPGYHITLKDETLTIAQLGTPEGLGPILGTFRHLDVAPPLAPQLVAQLTGIWVQQGADTVQRSEGTVVWVDTLIFHADSTFSSMDQPLINPVTLEPLPFPRWHHWRGDTLWLPGRQFQHVAVEGSRLILSDDRGRKKVYTRIP